MLALKLVRAPEGSSELIGVRIAQPTAETLFSTIHAQPIVTEAEVSSAPIERTNVDFEPLSLLASELGRIAAEIQAVECSHAERVEAASAALRGQREQIAADLRRQLQREFEAEAERQSLQKEVTASHRQATSEALDQEEVQTAEALTTLQNEIDAMLADPDADLSPIIQMNIRRAELHAYLRGLRFKVK
jgi:hypothetical protein